jgi:type II secretory pathway component PulC
MIASGPVKTSRPLASVSYALQGISGTATKRFAIINGRTFEVDEEAEIAVGNSRVRIRCLEIRADSVLIESSGEKRELKLRRGL